VEHQGWDAPLRVLIALWLLRLHFLWDAASILEPVYAIGLLVADFNNMISRIAVSLSFMDVAATANTEKETAVEN
jgi:hypothetical protein